MVLHLKELSLVSKIKSECYLKGKKNVLLNFKALFQCPYEPNGLNFTSQQTFSTALRNRHLDVGLKKPS